MGQFCQWIYISTIVKKIIDVYVINKAFIASPVLKLRYDGINGISHTLTVAALQEPAIIYLDQPTFEQRLEFRRQGNVLRSVLLWQVFHQVLHSSVHIH